MEMQKFENTYFALGELTDTVAWRLYLEGIEIFQTRRKQNVLYQV